MNSEQINQNKKKKNNFKLLKKSDFIDFNHIE